ncbi:hypothetical protein H6P81_013426 [Aristolochia fimbriata]|uniref:Stress up-regulated Nod 19 n=1 Tax=Aristolochia fimbriata TaxID=158543 RepID=A0AAV7EEX6_ARIFI|nr:hypothetical protein H6P81_013426 [Aristolochia fimbriata]
MNQTEDDEALSSQQRPRKVNLKSYGSKGLEVVNLKDVSPMVGSDDETQDPTSVSLTIETADFVFRYKDGGALVSDEEVMVICKRSLCTKRRRRKMKRCSLWMTFLSVIILSTVYVSAAQPVIIDENGWKSSVFLSPPFTLGPGSVLNKFYYDINFPRGHIALKGFDAEIVDELGNSIPLHETYIHHWLIVRYYSLVSSNEDLDQNIQKHIVAGNSGVCPGNILAQHFGLGSETRRTLTKVPDPYGIEIGNPAEIPDGYEEMWLLNVHAIDTRGVVDRMGCTECRCSLYNVTVDEYNRPLEKNYTGGLRCCHDQTQCKLRDGFEGVSRKLYLKYTVRWVDWDDSVVPVRIYIFDVTDSGKRTNSTKENMRLGCKVEYEVAGCREEASNIAKCVHNKKTNLPIPRGGELVYGVAHQHWGGVGSSLYGQSGQLLCSSNPIYGDGEEPGNEADYIVGMSTCYPKPGSVRIADGEILTLESKYNSSQMHTGVMGLFYILVADQPPLRLADYSISQAQADTRFPSYIWALVLAGIVVTVGIAVGYLRKNASTKDYRPM